MGSFLGSYRCSSKQTALRTVWRKTPLQLVVGPPGVGKTHLLAEYVRRSLSEESSQRILITAQGHQALDNAGQAVREVLTGANGLGDWLIVRSRTDKATANVGLYASEHAFGFLRRAASSSLARSAPQDHQSGLGEMLKVAEHGGQRKSAYIDRPREVRAMESVVMQAANVLLSTANSAELSRLVENGASFDEVIIEEAAKATGPELVAPMLLAMQRLLIGDHNQLPAFDSDRLIELLGDVQRVKTALQDCEDLIGFAFRDYGLEELLEAAEDPDRLARVCERARSAVRLFETLVKRDDDRAANHPKAPRVAVELTQQRRMHPVICHVVSRAFYGDRLKSSDVAEAFFADNPRPFTHDLAVMPRAPVVWVDLPYVQVKGGAGEQTPRFHNPAERAAVMAVLKQVRAGAGEKKPSLAVLSPYQRQADRLLRAIEDGRRGALAHPESFRSASSTGARAGTVDAFQGSEADLVVISLVRNNGEHGAGALGFLRDARRMNVLLSRARWQLVLVGSRDFFRAQSRQYGKGSIGGPEVGCIRTLMEIFDALEQESLPDGTPKFSMVSAAALLVRQA
jgi:AAA domain